MIIFTLWCTTAASLARHSDGNLGNRKQSLSMFNNLHGMEITQEEPTLRKCEDWKVKMPLSCLKSSSQIYAVQQRIELYSCTYFQTISVLINAKKGIFFRNGKGFHNEEGYSPLYLYPMISPKDFKIAYKGNWLLLFPISYLCKLNYEKKKFSCLMSFPVRTNRKAGFQIKFHTAVTCHAHLN